MEIENECGKIRKERASPPPSFPTVYRQQEFPVINKSTFGSAAMRASASDQIQMSSIP